MVQVNFPQYGTITVSLRTVADLAAFSPLKTIDGLHAIVEGQLSDADGLGGIFTWSATSTDTPDGVNIIASTSLTTGRWVRTVRSGVQTIASVVGLQSALDAKATPAYVKGVLGSREANVLDITGWDPTGVKDMAPGYQALINQASVSGVPVVMGVGKARLASTVYLPEGHVFRGLLTSGDGTRNRSRSSLFYLDHTGKGFVRGGTSEASVTITDQVTMRNQPISVRGKPYTASDHDWDYWFDDISDLRMTRVMQLNATRGIYIDNGGRIKISTWDAQCFKSGLQINSSYDTCHFSDIHIWPFSDLSDEVKGYTQGTLTAFNLGRVDNSFWDNIFTIWAKYAFYIRQFEGAGPNRPGGTCSKLKLSNADLDVGNVAYYVTPQANGHTAKFSNVTAQGMDASVGDPLLYVEGPNTRITGDFDGDHAGTNVIRVSATATGSRLALRTGSQSWNTGGVGFPAAESAGGLCELLPGSILTGGNGAPISGGNVKVW